MVMWSSINKTFKNSFPLFLLLCFSGNPFFTAQSNSKTILVIYTMIFSIYVFKEIGWMLPMKIVNRLLYLIICILILVLSQKSILGFVSYPGVFALILKILLGLFTILYYLLKKIDILDCYIKILVLLSIISIPFFILNQFWFYGLDLNSDITKSLLLYTSYDHFPDELLVRNAGMFWEPGAFAGYLILALLFIALKNGKLIIGSYNNETLWIITGLITTQSTTGYIVLMLLFFIYALQNYSWGKIIVIPFFLLIIIVAYNELPFMKGKIETQFLQLKDMNNDDISNTRFGSLSMDLQYIKAQPLIGNGWDLKTRYRFHPEVTEDIGNGNGMSNILACWGIPFFLIWLYCVYKSAQNISRSTNMAFIFLTMIILLLQGEQYLNYPLFLMFFTLPLAYNSTLNQTPRKKAQFKFS